MTKIWRPSGAVSESNVTTFTPCAIAFFKYGTTALASLAANSVDALTTCPFEAEKSAAVTVGAWFAGPPEELVAYLKSLEVTYPGLEHVHLSNSMGTPQHVMLEQLAWLGKEVMPSFVAR